MASTFVELRMLPGLRCERSARPLAAASQRRLPLSLQPAVDTQLLSQMAAARQGVVSCLAVGGLVAARSLCSRWGRRRRVRATRVRCHAGHEDLRHSLQRRAAVSLGMVIPSLGVCPGPAEAAITGSFREAVADFTSVLPGSAPSDVYYPPWFLGDWTADSELYGVEFPQGANKAPQEALLALDSLSSKPRESYRLRFKRYRNEIILDRATSVQRLLWTIGPKYVVESVKWDPTNANALTASLRRSDGQPVGREFYVTRRAVGAPEDRVDLFNVSEFYQDVSSGVRVDTRDISDVIAGNTPLATPRATPKRMVSKYKRVADALIQCIQRVEVFPEVARNPDGAAPPDLGDLFRGGGEAADSERPIAVYKYRVLLVAADPNDDRLDVPEAEEASTEQAAAAVGGRAL
eukprot:TRINITY_DN51012_c0_g1_i1.p1 TRINITY_DN51012_c0_g1~~TRINITY_DN51012_c0_g1_i1.p1  ORF type:complete len:406 (+),score=73.18 TRINITY_DN51012_c0_g1_i1:86-1303(+)